MNEYKRKVLMDILVTIIIYGLFFAFLAFLASCSKEQCYECADKSGYTQDVCGTEDDMQFYLEGMNKSGNEWTCVEK